MDTSLFLLLSGKRGSTKNYPHAGGMQSVVTRQTLYAACLMNCFAGCLQMAGTVMTHRMSSLAIRVEDWSESSWRQWSLKKRRACANTSIALSFFPLAAWISRPMCRSCRGDTEIERGGGGGRKGGREEGREGGRAGMTKQELCFQQQGQI